jgi:hypothetical protein
VADTVKVLGQLSPGATTLTDLYTVPAVTQVVASSLVICNQNAVAVTFRVSVAVAGAGDDPKQYIYYGQSLAANATFIATIGISLGAADVVRVYASSTAMSFNLYGVETT